MSRTGTMYQHEQPPTDRAFDRPATTDDLVRIAARFDELADVAELMDDLHRAEQWRTHATELLDHAMRRLDSQA